ncbi:phage-like protein [Achromatium sp. WMS3]|nr:phage-like protein [Achromatium sp. WMS3]
MQYPIVIHKEPDSDFGVTIPDIPGCFTAGESIEEAIVMAQEAIECHLEGLLIDNESIPLAKKIEEHQINKEYSNGVWVMIDIDIAKLSIKSKRVNVTLPARLLATIDQYAKKHGETRSGLLAQAVTEYMATHH